MSEPVDSLALACAERDSARRWARAWKRIAKYANHAAKGLSLDRLDSKGRATRAEAERDALAKSYDGALAEIERLTVVVEAARTYRAQSELSSMGEFAVEEGLDAALAALDAKP